MNEKTEKVEGAELTDNDLNGVSGGCLRWNVQLKDPLPGKKLI